MPYIVTATVAGASIRVDLDEIGFASQALSGVGRGVTHELETGDYEVRSQGYGPIQITLIGEFNPNNEELDTEAVFDEFIKMRGHKVTMRRGDKSEDGHLRNVNGTYHDWRQVRFIRVSWRADVILEQVGTLDVGG